MNINLWKVSINGFVVAQVQSCVAGLERPKIVAKSLGGSVYVQTVGNSVGYIAVQFLSTRDEMHLFNSLEAEGYVIDIRYRNRIYHGYFEETPQWSTVMPGEWYNATGKLLITSEEEVSND